MQQGHLMTSLDNAKIKKEKFISSVKKLTQIALCAPGNICSRIQHNFFIKLKCSILNWSWLCENAILLRRTDNQMGLGMVFSLQTFKKVVQLRNLKKEY